MKQKADDAGLGVVVYISMAFGNPYGDHWDEEEVTTAVSLLADMDVHSISLADTVGVADAQQISRLVSLEHSHEIKPGMVFALETFWPSKDGWRAARIEEEIVVTETGHEVITRFPAEQLLVAGQRYQTVTGPLSTMRERQSNLNRVDGAATPNGGTESPPPLRGRVGVGGPSPSPTERA